MINADILAAALPDHARSCDGCGLSFVRDQVSRHRMETHWPVRWSAAREVF